MSKNTQFMDRAVIRVAAGRGGRGLSHFRREKFVPLGGPDGGDGGHGGDVIMVAEPGINTLVDFAFRREFKAEDGHPGEKSRKSGRQGKDTIIRVPVGTMVLTADGELVADLNDAGQQAVVAEGGRGGRGNIHFATALKRSPTLAEKGEPGEARELILELKLLADAGIIGLPNAGKSTLLAAVSAAHPKIADYPFTTLTPNLGRVRIDEEHSFALVDIPGLIEGASRGQGLGHEFLRHIERTRLLIHVLDIGFPGVEPEKDFETINRELKLHNPKLAQRPQLVALNKVELRPEAEVEELAGRFRRQGFEVFKISAAARQGVGELMRRTYELATTLPLDEAAIPVHKPKPPEPESRFQLFQIGPHAWRASGREVEKWVAMTDFGNEEAVRKLKDIFDRIGLTEAFRSQVEEGDTVFVGEEEFTYQADEEYYGME